MGVTKATQGSGFSGLRFPPVPIKIGTEPLQSLTRIYRDVPFPLGLCPHRTKFLIVTMMICEDTDHRNDSNYKILKADRFNDLYPQSYLFGTGRLIFRTFQPAITKYIGNVHGFDGKIIFIDIPLKM